MVPEVMLQQTCRSAIVGLDPVKTTQAAAAGVVLLQGNVTHARLHWQPCCIRERPSVDAPRPTFQQKLYKEGPYQHQSGLHRELLGCRGFRAPEAVAAALAKRAYVRSTPYLVGPGLQTAAILHR